MKRNDGILIIVILIIALFSYVGFQMDSGNNGHTKLVEISVDGESYASFPLDEEQEVYIDEHNHIVIENGVVNMVEADCPDKLCVHQNSIDSIGESIICLPNKVVVSIVGEEDNTQQNDYDVTVK